MSRPLSSVHTEPMPMSAIALAQVKPRSRNWFNIGYDWRSPLLGSRGYATAGRAMAVALDYVGWFATAHSLASLAALEGELARL